MDNGSCRKNKVKTSNKNYSHELREFILYIEKEVNRRLPADSQDTSQEFKERMINSVVRSIVSALKFFYSNDAVNVSEAFRTSKILYVSCIWQLYVDLYKILNLREKLDIIDALDAETLDKLRHFKSEEEVYDVLSDPKNARLLYQALMFSDLSVYDKVLMMKAIDEEDKKILDKVSLVFNDEYEKYNVEVDEAFMTRQIKKWQEVAFKDDIEKSYEDAARFLDQYSLINNNLYERIRKSTEHTALDDTKGMLKKFYPHN